MNHGYINLSPTQIDSKTESFDPIALQKKANADRLKALRTLRKLTTSAGKNVYDELSKFLISLIPVQDLRKLKAKNDEVRQKLEAKQKAYRAAKEEKIRKKLDQMLNYILWTREGLDFRFWFDFLARGVSIEDLDDIEEQYDSLVGLLVDRMAGLYVSNFEFSASHPQTQGGVSGTRGNDQRSHLVDEDFHALDSYSVEEKDQEFFLDAMSDPQTLGQQFTSELNRLVEEKQLSGGGTTFNADLMWLNDHEEVQNLNVNLGDSNSRQIKIKLDAKNGTPEVKVEALTRELHGLGRNETNPFEGLSASNISDLKASDRAFYHSGRQWYLLSLQFSPTSAWQPIPGLLSELPAFTIVRNFHGVWYTAEGPTDSGLNMTHSLGDLDYHGDKQLQPALNFSVLGKPVNNIYEFNYVHKSSDGVKLSDEELRALIENILSNPYIKQRYLNKADDSVVKAQEWLRFVIREKITDAQKQRSRRTDNIRQVDVPSGSQLKLGQIILSVVTDGHGSKNGEGAIMSAFVSENAPLALRNVMANRIEEVKRQKREFIEKYFFNRPLGSITRNEIVEIRTAHSRRQPDFLKNIYLVVLLLNGEFDETLLSAIEKVNPADFLRVYNFAKQELKYSDQDINQVKGIINLYQHLKSQAKPTPPAKEAKSQSNSFIKSFMAEAVPKVPENPISYQPQYNWIERNTVRFELMLRTSGNKHAFAWTGAFRRTIREMFEESIVDLPSGQKINCVVELRKKFSNARFGFGRSGTEKAIDEKAQNDLISKRKEILTSDCKDDGQRYQKIKALVDNDKARLQLAQARKQAHPLIFFWLDEIAMKTKIEALSRLERRLQYPEQKHLNLDLMPALLDTLDVVKKGKTAKGLKECIRVVPIKEVCEFLLNVRSQVANTASTIPWELKGAIKTLFGGNYLAAEYALIKKQLSKISDKILLNPKEKNFEQIHRVHQSIKLVLQRGVLNTVHPDLQTACQALLDGKKILVASNLSVSSKGPSQPESSAIDVRLSEGAHP